MKKLTFTLLLALFSLTGMGQTYNYLTFRTSDGTEKSISINGLQLTFVNGNVVATSGDETATLSLSDLSVMYFSETAVETAIVLPAAQEVRQPLERYDLQGRRVRDAQRGLYIIRENGKTQKVLVK